MTEGGCVNNQPQACSATAPSFVYMRCDIRAGGCRCYNCVNAQT